MFEFRPQRIMLRINSNNCDQLFLIVQDDVLLHGYDAHATDYLLSLKCYNDSISSMNETNVLQFHTDAILIDSLNWAQKTHINLLQLFDCKPSIGIELALNSLCTRFVQEISNNVCVSVCGKMFSLLGIYLFEQAFGSACKRFTSCCWCYGRHWSWQRWRWHGELYVMLP